MTRKTISILFALIAVAFTSQAAFANDDEQSSLEGQSVYTQVNIWYEKPMKILATNYHRGAMLPIGSAVTIDSVGTKRIEFSDKHGGKFRIIINMRHTNIPGPEFVKRLFSKKNVMRKSGKVSKLSKLERKNIKAGTIAKGMSKKAVLMAYGYPPTSRTHSIEQDNWTFWTNRWVTRVITFENNKVVNIRG